MKINTHLDFQGNEIKLATPEKVNELPDSNLFIGRTCVLISEKEVDDSTISVGSIYYYNGEQWCHIEVEPLKINETKINVIDDEITLHTFNTLADAKTYINSNTKPKSVVIGANAGITSIVNYAFASCTSLKSITIPSSVTSIGTSAFNGCTSLTSINIPSGVTSISNNAFNGCTSLTSITIPSVTSIGNIGNSAFRNCTSLTSITIPRSVTSIDDNAFKNCTSIASITIPSSVTSIGSYVFSGCTSLTSITISYSVTSIGDGAFSGCTSLKSIAIPSSVTSIGTNAFGGCDILLLDNYKSKTGYPWGATDILIHNEKVTTTIDENSTDRQVPTANGVYNFIAENIFSIKFDMDYLKEYIERSITSITIPDGITSIGNSAFENCTSLTSITIPSSVTSISIFAFASCTSLKSITIPSSVTSIGANVFKNCTSLTSITINKPEGSIAGAPWGATDATVQWTG